jgi:hypothetical protein
MRAQIGDRINVSGDDTPDYATVEAFTETTAVMRCADGGLTRLAIELVDEMASEAEKQSS